MLIGKKRKISSEHLKRFIWTFIFNIGFFMQTAVLTYVTGAILAQSDWYEH